MSHDPYGNHYGKTYGSGGSSCRSHYDGMVDAEELRGRDVARWRRY